ncbi:hypothetical protein SLEP1_g45046 [Rubroshorea leprosula]|uniref:Transposase n=1 Tax=Rubroshorea leprosula TaxID=152421 RepID=A0AAV5LHU8_9ROSI|nr:hypothetical protein SLEP1_g45046 [Rubroshorea leprosula]
MACKLIENHRKDAKITMVKIFASESLLSYWRNILSPKVSLSLVMIDPRLYLAEE